MHARPTKVWDCSSGTKLRCMQDVHMERDERYGFGGEKVFTAGQCYEVQSMHPVADPPFVQLLNDQGEPHLMEDADLRAYFSRARG